MLIITEVKIIPYQLPPLFFQHSQGEYGKTARESTLLIAEIGVPLILPHSKAGIPFHQRMKGRILNGAGTKLIDSLFGQSCDGQIPLFRSFELHRIAVGKILLRKKLAQVVQHFAVTFLRAVLGRNADDGKGIVGRCRELLCFPLLKVERKPAGPVFFQLFHHIRPDLLNQS